ncbi:MAG: flagellar protein FlaG [Spirochaetaceae bacterium]|jgi:flagellar protein FlaG|nr:flagellar protein FlaG [Spirochaetaceae bacterium]
MLTEMIGTGNTAIAQEFGGYKKTEKRSSEKIVPGAVLSAQASVAQKSQAEIEKITADIGRISLAFNKKLKFTVDYKDHDITVKVIDPETDKVIKELPPKELEQLRDQIKDAIGVLFNVQI